MVGMTTRIEILKAVVSNIFQDTINSMSDIIFKDQLV